MIDTQIVLALSVVFGSATITMALRNQGKDRKRPSESDLVAELRREIHALTEEVQGLKVAGRLMLAQLNEQNTTIHRLETSYEAVEAENKLFRRRFAELGLKEQ